MPLRDEGTNDDETDDDNASHGRRSDAGKGHATDEERRSGFERGGWAMGAFGDETGTLVTQTYQGADAFLFGRRTYAMFAGTWGAVEEMRTHPIGVAWNRVPKYVASTTLTCPHWENSTVLSGDLATAIRRTESPAGRRVAGSWQRRPDPIAARKRPGR
jgi:hypothetical protein